MISAFGTLGPVLQGLFEEIREVENLDEDAALAKVRVRLQRFYEAYRSDNEFRLDYTDPWARFAYLYLYTGAHANLFAKALMELEYLDDEVLERIDYEGMPLSICAFGGGPGSELIGAAKYLAAHEINVPVRFLLVDKVPYWGESWETLAESLRREGLNVISRTFVPLDFTDADSFYQFYSAFKKYWLFVFNYAVSETYEKAEQIGKFVHWLARNTEKISPLFVFIDRNQQEVVDAIHQIIHLGGLTIQRHLFDTRGRLPLDEQKDLLGDWLERLDWRPKLKWNAYMCWATTAKKE